MSYELKPGPEHRNLTPADWRRAHAELRAANEEFLDAQARLRGAHLNMRQSYLAMLDNPGYTPAERRGIEENVKYHEDQYFKYGG